MGPIPGTGMPGAAMGKAFGYTGAPGIRAPSAGTRAAGATVAGTGGGSAAMPTAVGLKASLRTGKGTVRAYASTPTGNKSAPRGLDL